MVDEGFEGNFTWSRQGARVVYNPEATLVTLVVARVVSLPLPLVLREGECGNWNEGMAK